MLALAYETKHQDGAATGSRLSQMAIRRCVNGLRHAWCLCCNALSQSVLLVRLKCRRCALFLDRKPMVVASLAG